MSLGGLPHLLVDERIVRVPGVAHSRPVAGQESLGSLSFGHVQVGIDSGQQEFLVDALCGNRALGGYN